MVFDNNFESFWILNGVVFFGMQWIGFEFFYFVFIGLVQIFIEEDKLDWFLVLMYVEFLCEKYFRQFVIQWVIFNLDYSVDKCYNGKL